MPKVKPIKLKRDKGHFVIEPAWKELPLKIERLAKHKFAHETDKIRAAEEQVRATAKVKKFVREGTDWFIVNYFKRRGVAIPKAKYLLESFLEEFGDDPNKVIVLLRRIGKKISIIPQREARNLKELALDYAKRSAHEIVESNEILVAPYTFTEYGIGVGGCVDHTHVAIASLNFVKELLDSFKKKNKEYCKIEDIYFVRREGHSFAHFTMNGTKYVFDVDIPAPRINEVLEGTYGKELKKDWETEGKYREGISAIHIGLHLGTNKRLKN